MKNVPIEPERGQLLADDGSVLAANLQFYVVRIDWFTEGIKDSVFMKEIGPLCDSLAKFDGSMTAQQWRKKILEDRKNILDAAEKTDSTGKKGRMNRAYKLFPRMLTHNEYKRIRQFPFLCLAKNKNGLVTEKHNRRIKPYGNMAGRSIGSVGQDSLSSSEHGRSGLEMALDSLLYGKPGIAQSLQLTNSIIKAESVPAVKGYDINEYPDGIGHTWNIATLGGNDYYIDLTWDDPMFQDGLERLSHDYFCITTEELLETHIINQPDDYPICTAVEYDYFRMNGYYVGSYDYETVADALYIQTGGFYYLKFDSAEDCTEAIDILVSDGVFRDMEGIWDAYMYYTSLNGRILTIQIIDE